MNDETENGVPPKQPIIVSLAEENKEDQENFVDAVDQTHIRADITVSDTGQQLLDELQDVTTPNPDIIFMDQGLKLNNGKDALKEIKKDELLKDIPTVIYTESSAEKDIDAAYKGGADLYVPKPIFFRNLVRVIRKIFLMSLRNFLPRQLRKNFVLKEEDINDLRTTSSKNRNTEGQVGK